MEKQSHLRSHPGGTENDTDQEKSRMGKKIRRRGGLKQGISDIGKDVDNTFLRRILHTWRKVLIMIVAAELGKGEAELNRRENYKKGAYGISNMGNSRGETSKSYQSAQ